MASHTMAAPTPRDTQKTKQQEYYPLWKYVTKIKQLPGGGSWEWRCNLCNNGKNYKGSYTRVKAHILHEGVKGVDVCGHTKNPEERAKFNREHNDAMRLKEQRSTFGKSDIGNTRLAATSEPRIVHEARKRRAAQLEDEMASSALGGNDSRLLKMFNNQERDEAESRVARALYACGIPFNVVRSPYWQDMVRAINTAPQGFKGPNYEKIRTVLLKKERLLIEDVLRPIRSSWANSGVSIISDGWTDTRRRPLINIIASSPAGAMFLRAEDCSGELKDSHFIADVLISAIEQVGPDKVVQVITDNAPVCKAAGLIIESRYNHIFWTPCIVHNINLILEEIEHKTAWVKEITGQAREIIKFITNHHLSQAIYREYSKLELLKVAETRYASNFIMLRRLVEVKNALMSMVVGPTWAEWRQADSERGSCVRRLLIDEDWWSKIDFLLKFTLPAFELLREADTDRPFLGEVYDGMDSMVEKTVEIITQEAPTLLFVDADFAEQVRSIIVTRWNGFNTPLHTLAHALTPRFYDIDLIAQSNGKRKAPHQDKEVAIGVKKAFQRLFLASLQTEVREEFACFASGLEDFGDMSALDERGSMNPLKWWTCHGANGVHLQSLATRILSQVASSSAAERNWSTYGFIHSVKRNRLGSQKAEDLVYVHSNLRLVSRRGEEYTNGPHKEWDVEAENPDLDLSLAALDITDGTSGASGSGIGSSTPCATVVGRASCSIFDDVDEEYM